MVGGVRDVITGGWSKMYYCRKWESEGVVGGVRDVIVVW